MNWKEASELYDKLYENKLPGEIIGLSSNGPPFRVSYKPNYGHEQKYTVTNLKELEKLREEHYEPPKEEALSSGVPSLIFGRGSDTWERKVMQDRYKKRNERLDSLPSEQKEGMKKFFNKFGVNKTAPSGFTAPPKEDK